ncbi:MAG: hypothetical protein U0M06_13505 [Clostridia bacterium]|nr:hypothetical protein [Clostridia bacterium]
MAKKANDIKIKRTELLYYRMLVVLGALIAVIFSITYLTRTTEAENIFRLDTAPVVGLVLAVLSLPAIAYFLICRIKGKDEKLVVFSSGFLLTLALWLTSVFALYSSISSKRHIAYIIVTAALYFVYYMFSAEFFAFSLYSAVGAALLVLINSATRPMHIAYSAVVVAVSVLAIVLALLDKKKPVSLKIGKSNLKLTNGAFKVYPFCVAAGIMLAGVILSFMFASMAFYALIVLFVYYLVFTVVNTVKMM